MKEEYEYIFAGSGVAGATVAKRLLEKKRNTSILMLEAGPEIPSKDRRSWWDHVISGYRPYAVTYDQPGETATVGNTLWDFRENRVTAYGGSTIHWGGWCLRFKPEDFHLQTNTGAGGDWPFCYETLEPYYDEAEAYLSVCGDDTESWNSIRKKPYPMPPFEWTAPDGEMIEAFRRLDIEPGRMPIARYRKCLATGTCKYCPFGARFSAQYVLDDLRRDERHVQFKIRCKSPATRVLVHSRRKIAGVEYLDSTTGQAHQAFAGTVIVCSGSYESPKLLMLSRSKYWKDGIGNDHDLLGRHIISHSMLAVTGTKPKNDECWFQEYDFPTLMSRTYDAPEYQKGGKLFIFKNRAIPKFDFADHMIKGRPRAEIDALLRGPRQMELQAFLEEKGRYDSRLTMGDGKNRFGLPHTRVDFNRTDQDRVDSQARLDLMERVIREMGYEVKSRRVEDPGGHHTTGTCRMGLTEKEGVTDKNLRVHGTDNLYVCSNAAFPSGSAVNPTLTLTALSLRLAEHLRPSTSRARTSRSPRPEPVAI